MPIAIDNGAWSAFIKGIEWSGKYRTKWIELVELLGARAQWVVAPDIVGGGIDSLETSVGWLPWILERAPIALIAVQDGMHDYDVAPIIAECDGRVGIFLGGTTEWKWSTAAEWGELAARWGVPYHIARVNSQRALRIAGTVGATSIDGTGPVQFPSVLERLERERGQAKLELHAPPVPCCGIDTELWTEAHTGAQYCMNCGEQYAPGVYFGATNAPDQLDLFPDVARAPRAKAWEAGPKHPHGGKGREYYHSSGWWVYHVGHPTALYPYVAVDPDGHGYLSHNGLGFSKLAEAKAAVEAHLAGRIKSVVAEGKPRRLDNLKLILEARR